jgi:predicted RNase H-like HicB family nuclease
MHLCHQPLGYASLTQPTYFFQEANLMNFHIEYEREDDGRWLAEVPQIPGAMAYGATADEAMGKAEALMLRILAERIETGENRPIPITIELTAP